MTSVNVWVTLVTGAWVDAITGGLVRMGYTVRPLERMTYDTEFSTTLLILVSGEKSSDKIRDDIIALLKKLKASYHNVVCVNTAGGTVYWAHGTIFKPEPPPTTVPPGIAALLDEKDEFTE